MNGTLSRADFGLVRELLRRRSGIVLDDGKEYLVELRLGLLARREGFGSLATLVAQVRSQRNEALSQRVVEAMTTNETSFFRDHHPFEALRHHVLPRLAARRAAERRLTIWCAASSSGQEPYSIAMLLRELGLCAPSWDIRFVASDLSREMLARARLGTYSMLEVNRGLPAPMLVKHFRAVDGAYRISDELSNMVQFSEINLSESWPALSDIDLLFMRNVLIYFDDCTKRQILGKIGRTLSPFGCLFLGAAETTLNLDRSFHRKEHGKATWYQSSAAEL